MISEDRAFFLKLVQPDLDEDDLDCWSSLIFTFYDRALKISFLPQVGPNVVIDLCLSNKTKIFALQRKHASAPAYQLWPKYNFGGRWGCFLATIRPKFHFLCATYGIKKVLVFTKRASM